MQPQNGMQMQIQMKKTNSKALTQGTEDIHNRNVGCTQDPCTSLEASAQGTSAKGTETTAVVLESPPHKMQS